MPPRLRIRDLVLDKTQHDPAVPAARAPHVHLISYGAGSPNAAAVRAPACRELHMATATVQRTYSELQSQGLLVGRRGAASSWRTWRAASRSGQGARRDAARAAGRPVARRSLGFSNAELLEAIDAVASGRPRRSTPAASPHVVFVGHQPGGGTQVSGLAERAARGMGWRCAASCSPTSSGREHPGVEPIQMLVALIGTFPALQEVARRREDDQPVQHPGQVAEHERESTVASGETDPLRRRVRDVALVPQDHVLQRRLGRAAVQSGRGPRCARDTHRVALVRHRRESPYSPSANGSWTSRTSVQARSRIIRRHLVEGRRGGIARAVMNSACRFPHGITWVDASTLRRSSRAQIRPSTSGTRGCVGADGAADQRPRRRPRGPDGAGHGSDSGWNAQTASLCPKLVGLGHHAVEIGRPSRCPDGGARVAWSWRAGA